MREDFDYCPEPPEDFEPPDFDELGYELDKALELARAAREPFTFRDEDDWKTRAAFYGDLDDLRAIGRMREVRERRDRDFWEETPRTAPLAAADLAALRDHDAQWDCDGEDLNADDLREDRTLEAIGRALYEKNPNFWRRLRRLGQRGIPASLVAEANESLFPSGWERPKDERPVSAPARRQRVPCQIFGYRRESSGSNRRAAKRGATRAGPDDDGDPEPAGASPGAGRQPETTGRAPGRTRARSDLT